MTERKPKSKYMNIKVDTRTGKIVEVLDEYGKKAKTVGRKKLDEVYQSRNGFKYVGTVAYAQSSPG
jgi:uncharacterized protein Veg